MRPVVLVLSGILLLVAVGLVACGGGNGTAVATVNDEEITRAELQARMDQVLPGYQSQIAEQGLELDDQMVADLEREVLDDLITFTVLLQAATRHGFTTTSGEVEAEYDQIAAQLGGHAELEEAMELQGITPDELREQIAVEQYLDLRFADIDFEFSDEQVEALYEQYRTAFEDMPPLEEVRDLLLQDLEQQEQGRIVQDIIRELKDQSDIQILV